MKKTLITTMMISGVVLGLGTMNKVSAADATTADTTASATFVAGEDPSLPGSGPLAITNVTSGVDFGSSAVSATDSTLQSSSDINVSVSDLRGTFAGWNVSVSGTPLMSDGATPTELKGATLALPDGTITAAATGTDATKMTAAASANVLGGGSAQINAPVDNGTGAITTNYKQTDIALHVIGGTARVAKYSTTLTWTLTDAPA